MRKVYYDVTHLRHNAHRGLNSGIRRIDFEFADFFLSRRAGSQALQYGVAGPSVVTPRAAVDALLGGLRARRDHARDERARADVLTALLRGTLPGRPRSAAVERYDRHAISYLRFLHAPSPSIDSGAVYLNIGQHALGYDVFFRWLDGRPDVQGVFFVHDLLPLDYPEFWRRGYRDRFETGVAMLARVGRAFIVSSDAVKERLDRELRRRGRTGVPILSLPFPPFLGPGTSGNAAPDELGAEPYFVMVGTIEPRKNHLLILNLWRRMAEQGGPVPKLVLVGGRGWENEQVVDMLERCIAIGASVIEAPALTDADMRALVAHARALLYPSFEEGFGLPLAEALMLGTPVLASDIPVLRQTAQERALFLDPLDGPAWLAAIRALADPENPTARAVRALAAAYEPPAVDRYFETVERFVQGL